MQHEFKDVIDKHTAAQYNPAALDYQEGQVLLMNKPYGWTSFQLVNKVKNMLQQYYGINKIKVGHAGTLDPLASGLMILCTGRMTKSIEKFQDLEKTYEAEMKTGTVTPSYDRETEESHSFPADHITEKQLRDVFSEFLGEQKQYPPVFSAKKIKGQRAYKKARKGEKVETRPIMVTIYRLELLKFSKPFARFKVTCSKGTYIRTLVKNLGEALQSGAYLTALKRTAIGSYFVKDSLNPEEFEGYFQNS